MNLIQATIITRLATTPRNIYYTSDLTVTKILQLLMMLLRRY